MVFYHSITWLSALLKTQWIFFPVVHPDVWIKSLPSDKESPLFQQSWIVVLVVITRWRHWMGKIFPFKLWYVAVVFFVSVVFRLTIPSVVSISWKNQIFFFWSALLLYGFFWVFNFFKKPRVSLFKLVSMLQSEGFSSVSIYLILTCKLNGLEIFIIIFSFLGNNFHAHTKEMSFKENRLVWVWNAYRDAMSLNNLNSILYRLIYNLSWNHLHM